MPDKVSWGVLSTAKIGLEHVIPAMQQGAVSAVTALASRDLAKAQAIADKLGIAKAYGSYEELLADPAIDAIYNPLPNHMHVPWSIKALEAGKHVLCEKPIALSADEARQLADAATRTGRLVAEAFMVRHHPQWQAAKTLVDSGRIGEARAVQTFFSFFLDDPDNIRNKAEMGGGGLFDVGCYAINTSRYIFGAEPERVVGMMDVDPANGTDRMMSGLAEYPGRRHLTFTCGTRLAATQQVCIVGTAGRIAIEIPFNPVANEVTRISVDDGRDLKGGGCEIIEVSAADQYTNQGDAFSRAILTGGSVASGLDDTIRNMRVIDAFFRSGRTGQWERP